MVAVALVSRSRSPRRHHHDPVEDAILRGKIETVLAEAKRRWPSLDEVPGRNKMSRILAADETVRELGYTEHAVRKILGGDYPASRRLNIPGYLSDEAVNSYQ